MAAIIFEMQKKVAIVGGSGFIGCNIANYLSERNYHVLVIGRNFEKEKYSKKNIEFKVLDANFTSKLFETTKNYPNIIWLVNSLVPSTSMDSLVDNFIHNVSPLVKYLELCGQAHHAIKKFIFLSSGGTIYGNPSGDNRLLNEDAIQKPISAYGLSKQISENYLKYLSDKNGFTSYILRPSNVYGIHQNLRKPQGIIGYAFNSIKSKQTLFLYNQGKIVRDFIHVNDLSLAIRLCIDDNRPNSSTDNIHTYNVSSKIEISIIEVVDLISETTGIKVKVIQKPARAFDCEYNVLDNSKIIQELKWKPQVSLQAGLKDMWSWFSQTTINTD